MKPEQELAKAMRMVVEALQQLGFTDTHILGLTNLCLNGHVGPEGEFTQAYQEYARQALKLRQDQPVQLITVIQG